MVGEGVTMDEVFVLTAHFAGNKGFTIVGIYRTEKEAERRKEEHKLSTPKQIEGFYFYEIKRWRVGL